MVSTLIPVFNGENYIAEAIDSAIAQRGVENEVIVIDDGSTDDTPEILSSYGDAIRLIRQENAGHVAARNRGAELANGQWLAFLDADDVWLPEKLARQLEVVDEGIGMIYTDRENFGDVSRVGQNGSSAQTLCEGDLFEPLLLGNVVTLSSVIMRSDWFVRLGGFHDMHGCDDWDLWLRFAAEGGKARVCRDALTRYRWHSSAMSRNASRMRDGRLEVIRRAIASQRGMMASPAIIQKAYSNAWSCSAWHAAPASRWKALAWYCRAAWHAPFEGAIYNNALRALLRLGI